MCLSRGGWNKCEVGGVALGEAPLEWNVCGKNELDHSGPGIPVPRKPVICHER